MQAALSLLAYFETFGQPLDENDLIAACFEGICTKFKAKWK
jgi:hypothetical protein